MRQETGERPDRDARAEGEDPELCQGRGQCARKLEQHDTDSDESSIARQGREHGGALPLRSRHRAQDVGDGEQCDCHEERNHAKNVAPSPLLGHVGRDRGTDERRENPR